LNGFNDWTNLKYIVAQGLSGQTLQVPNEQTMNDVRGSRLVLLEGVDNAIQRLVDSQPGTPTQKPTGEFDTTYLVQLLKTDQLGVAIEELTNLEAKVIQVFGEKAADKEVVPEIENLIGALEKDDQQQQQQQQQQQKEETMDDVITSRLELLEGVDNAIQRLVDSQPGTPTQKPTEGFDIAHIIQLLKTDQIGAAIEELTRLGGFDTTHIIQLLKTDQIGAAIEELTRLEPSTSIQKPTEEEFDTTHIAQLLKTEQLDAAIAKLTKLEAKVIQVFGEEAANKEVVPEIENLIGALQKQEFSPPSSSPPSAVLLS
jgi:vacuolar-type H+-ATPase subunit I/STV1